MGLFALWTYFVELVVFCLLECWCATRILVFGFDICCFVLIDLTFLSFYEFGLFWVGDVWCP